MKVWAIPWFERPGNRLKKQGADVLSDAELLAIVLGRGSKEENVIDCFCLVLGEQNRLDTTNHHPRDVGVGWNPGCVFDSSTRGVQPCDKSKLPCGYSCT